MATQTHTRHVGNTRTAISATLKQEDENGDLQVVDVSSLDVHFDMYDRNGTKVVDAGTVAKDDGVNGKVSYDFQSADVDTPGTYRAYFVVTESGEPDHFPIVNGELLIEILPN